MRKKLVVGNWKMHGNLVENKQLLDALVTDLTELKNAQIAVCVPFPYLHSIKENLRQTNISWGAQNLSQFDKGAYTGEVSASMLKDFGCKYVIVGHSERRALFGETNQVVAEKFIAAQKMGLIPILCVGETLEQREAGLAEKIIDEQLSVVIELAGIDAFDKSVIAYEPVWAIGTGKTASPQQAQEVHASIRKGLRDKNREIADELVILYGGSVKASNATELFVMDDIDGGLIGGASLIASEFISICRALNN